MMNTAYWGGMHMGYGADAFLPAIVFPFALALIAWVLFWKITGVWHAAKRGDKWWFVGLLFLNTLGILEIIYLFYVAKVTRNELWPK